MELHARGSDLNPRDMVGSSSSSIQSRRTSGGSGGPSRNKRGDLFMNFHRRGTPTLLTPVHLTAPVTCQPMNVTWQHVGTPPYTLMVAFEQWTTDIVQLPDSYFDGIAPNETALYQYPIPFFAGYDGPTNPNMIVSITDSSGKMSNSSSIITVSNGTLTCPEAPGKVDFYIIIPDNSTPSQCRPWSLSWQHITESPQSLVPPLSIFLLPSQEPPIAIRVPNSLTSGRGNGSAVDGTYTFTLPIDGNRRFLTTMSDHGPLGSGGVLGVTSPAFDESNSDDCLQPDALATLPRLLPSPTRTLADRPPVTPIIGGSSKGIPILVNSGGTLTTGYAAYGIADAGAQTIYDTIPTGDGNGGVGGPLGTGGLIGVVLGAGFVAGALLATLAWLFVRARRRDRHEYHIQQQKAIAELARLAGKYGGGENGDGNGHGHGNGSLSPGSGGGGGGDGHHSDLRQRSGRPTNGDTPLMEMRQTFSDTSPTEELNSAGDGGFRSPQSQRRRAGQAGGGGAEAGGGVAAAVGDVMSRLRHGRLGGGGGGGPGQMGDSFHSLHSLDVSAPGPFGGIPLTASHSSTPSMNTAPRTPGGYATDRSQRRGDGSPTSPISGTGSIPPFHDGPGRDSFGAGAAGGARVGSPSDQSGSWYPDASMGGGSSTFNSSRRGGAGPSTGSGTRSTNRIPTLVQHADAGLIMDDNVYDDEVQNVVELPPQYDSIEIRGTQSPTPGPGAAGRSTRGGSSAGGGGGNNSAPNSAGPNNMSFSASGSSAGLGNWFPTSPTSGSGTGSGTGGTGTAESDLLVAHMSRTPSSAPPTSCSEPARSGLGLAAPPSGSASLPLGSGASPAMSSQPSTTDQTHSSPPSVGAAPTAGPSTSSSEKRPKLKLATPATAAASGLLEDMLRGTGAGPQYSLAPATDGAEGSTPIPHNHPIYVGEAEPEEWETIPPEVLRRRGVRRRAPAGGGTGTVGTDGTSSTGLTSAGGTASNAGSTGFPTSVGGGTGQGLASGSGGQPPAVEEEVEEEDEPIPDESEFWITPRG